MKEKWKRAIYYVVSGFLTGPIAPLILWIYYRQHDDAKKIREELEVHKKFRYCWRCGAQL